eukprot:CAMPEP_0201923504 /NCGR_PEP_ID=MMETSP0903-20130614/11241_1 /ASSEMBLY_ACC=CAM_ASM_000552 /TAXON_ID=420261 /ORGANISM="Thalassiosira antarctica, Strain CCMP982" /LENGTH=52 /DNA_ID=CAMNT_0048460837 /DNA_START=443 /DNA_END=601 /DNA_ORIENTATION=+
MTTSFDAISDLANSAGEAKAAVVLLLMMDGAALRAVNAAADPARKVAPKAAA